MEELVLIEATNLRKFATRLEKARLDFDTLNPEYGSRCIYGQMTGNCFCERAVDLIVSSASEVYEIINPDRALVNVKLNGPPIVMRRKRVAYVQSGFYSPIEIFISKNANKKNGNISALVNYLKGKTNKLTLKNK